MERKNAKKSYQRLLTSDVARSTVFFSRAQTNGINGSFIKCHGEAIHNLKTDFFLSFKF